MNHCPKCGRFCYKYRWNEDGNEKVSNVEIYCHKHYWIPTEDWDWDSLHYNQMKQEISL